MFARNDIYFRLNLLLIIIHITCISLSLRRTSAPIHLTSVLGVFGTQETSYIVIAGLLERDTFDLFLPEFDKPWVIHLRETCFCSTNLCTWRPNTVYKNRSVRRHHQVTDGWLNRTSRQLSKPPLIALVIIMISIITFPRSCRPFNKENHCPRVRQAIQSHLQKMKSWWMPIARETLPLS
jgi:hypothetical protein